MIPTLTDGPVTLRAHTAADAPGVVEQSVDPLSRRWTTVPLEYGEQDGLRFVTEVMPGGWASGSEWAFAVDVGGRYAGTVSLRPQTAHRAEIAYGSHPWVRGTGHLRTALRMLLDWGFAARGLACVAWWANRGNWASRRTAWALGFTVEGTVRGYLDHRGEATDAWVGTLLRGDDREPKSTWLAVPTLRGERVVLRPAADDDVPRVVEACRDERTRYWLAPLPTPYGASDAREWILSRQEAAAAGRCVPWVLADPDGNRLLGSLDLFDIRGKGSAMIGYWTHPEARGRGLMRAAVPLALGHAFDGVGLQVVRIGAAPDNTASLHIIETAGFARVGLERSLVTVGDGRSDAWLYDLTAAEWSARSSRAPST